MVQEKYGVQLTSEERERLRQLIRSGQHSRVDSGRGQNRTLSPLSALWPLVFAGEQDVGPPKG